MVSESLDQQRLMGYLWKDNIHIFRLAPIFRNHVTGYITVTSWKSGLNLPAIKIFIFVLSNKAVLVCAYRVLIIHWKVEACRFLPAISLLVGSRDVRIAYVITNLRFLQTLVYNWYNNGCIPHTSYLLLNNAPFHHFNGNFLRFHESTIVIW